MNRCGVRLSDFALMLPYRLIRIPNLLCADDGFARSATVLPNMDIEPHGYNVPWPCGELFWP
jgi:hypothetical protein